MTTINFVGTYDPIVCGIGDYTRFITRQSPPDAWRVICFNLENLGLSSGNGHKPLDERLWYGIPSYSDFSASAVLTGASRLNGTIGNTVLWFQHEHGIWRDDDRFIAMLSEIFLPKVVTLHTLHFQSVQTLSGLRAVQRDFLRKLLPNVDAITVFSNGVYRAVSQEFPEYRHKVFVVRHGMHFRPDICRLSRQEAKKRLHEYLVYDSSLDASSKMALHRGRILLDSETFVIGETGFLCPGKQSELLYFVRDLVQLSMPDSRIAALRIGAVREPIQREYAHYLRTKTDDSNKFLLETRLPEDMLRIAQRAFDVNFYWPKECSQSGILAHALGSGAMVAGRDLEGSGEILRESGAITDKTILGIIGKIVAHVSCPERYLSIEGKTLSYALRYDWNAQAKLHYDLARQFALFPQRSGNAKERRDWNALLPMLYADHQLQNGTRSITTGNSDSVPEFSKG